ncbi:hypothetical protein ETAC_11915 [Edwardsiella piscicida C07-087]|nr:hypothetical protein ETAC_11915 [Edwardsiella piscicida C07-087]
MLLSRSRTQDKLILLRNIANHSHWITEHLLPGKHLEKIKSIGAITTSLYLGGKIIQVSILQSSLMLLTEERKKTKHLLMNGLMVSSLVFLFGT